MNNCVNLKLSICGNFKCPRNWSAERFELFSCLTTGCTPLCHATVHHLCLRENLECRYAQPSLYLYITGSFWHDQHNCLQYGEIYYVWFDIWYTYRIQYNRGFRGGTVGAISCNIYNLLQNIAIFHNMLQYYATLEICCSAWSKPKLSTKIDLHTPPPPPPPPQGTFIPEGEIVGFRGRVFVGWVVVVEGSTQLCGHPNFVLCWSWVVKIKIAMY